ncbi:MAG: hypothetical protein AB8B64_17830 [Granulosicoccus sp.]
MTTMRQYVLFFSLATLYASCIYAQEPVYFKNCSQAQNAENYELFAVNFVEECTPESNEIDAFGDVLAGLIGNESTALIQDKVDVLNALRDRVQALNSLNPAVPKTSIDEFTLALQCDILQLENTPTEMCKEYTATGNALRLQKWQAGDFSGSAYRNIFLDVFDATSPDCLASAVDKASACHATITKQMGPILELYRIMSKVVLPAINKDVRTAVADRYNANQLRWKSYVQETGFQYPWELTFNRKRNGGFSEVALGKEAPTQRWVLLHPTAGLYHSEKLPDGDQTALLGILKIIGKKIWKYSDDKKPKNIFGISLTTTFADLAGIEDVGYGIMAEYNGFALGISRHGSEQMLIMNIELQNLLTARPRSFSQWLKGQW